MSGHILGDTLQFEGLGAACVVVRKRLVRVHSRG